MFSKTKDGAPDAPAPRKPEPASLVAEGVSIAGNIATTGDLHLDGAVEGDLQVGVLTIGEPGSVTGAIQADTVEVRGRVTGVICARRVKLWASARVEGDISHTELAIEPGARFEGRSVMLAPVEDAPPLSVVAAE